jgi:pSer/pThr/pTyr-binding forkhead associated (FHA) protein
MWILQSADGNDPSLRFRIPAGTSKTVGRAPSADIILDANLVSRIHCRLDAAVDSVQVIDLSSTNGTFVNDARVEQGQLTHGDRLRVGRMELQIERLESDASDDDSLTAEGTDSSAARDQSS